VEKEKSLLGFDNREAAAALLRKWNFQEEVVSPILFQDTPFECEEVRPLACLLHVTATGIRDLPSDKLVDEPKSLRSSFNTDGGVLSAINLSPKALFDGLVESMIDFQAFSKDLRV
jgi:HD-like signal output (HDOD) protein